MAKKASYLSPKKVLPESEYEKYKKLRRIVERENLRKKVKAYSGSAKQIEYSKSKSGKVGSVLSGAFRMLSQRRGVTRALYGQGTGTTGTGIIKQRTGRKGRPAGTLDRRYAAYGGVYGYRKAMAHQRATINPEQQAVLRQVAQRQQAVRMNPENQATPDTVGTIDFRKIFQDIDEATNLVA